RTIKELRDAGGDVDGTACDVRDADQVRSLVEEANAAGPINVLVNNVGRGGGGQTAQIPDELWDDVIATNLASVFRVTRAFLASGLKDAGWGR
ncbi:SDR family NAD(P)-dependent oxidoreductase, partial [Micromonospora aurantiaca]|nr:SDR family NAD(P)-dependent oxidoreductase [Micromonospora aurantiaca]